MASSTAVGAEVANRSVFVNEGEEAMLTNENLDDHVRYHDNAFDNGWALLAVIDDAEDNLGTEVSIAPPLAAQPEVHHVGIEFRSVDCSGGFLGKKVYHEIVEIQAFTLVNELGGGDDDGPRCPVPAS